MENGKDFIYEYSDLNLFYTRVKILTGKYTNITLEFGSSVLIQSSLEDEFKFDYILYEVPNKFSAIKLRKNKFFNNFLAKLLIAIIVSRRNDPNEKEKLDESASAFGKKYSNIPISSKWYPYGQNNHLEHIKEQPKVTGFQGF
jgi:hypothetical protein